MKLWSIPDCEQQHTFKGHEGFVGCVKFHPKATIADTQNTCELASCGYDGSVKLWSMDRYLSSITYFEFTSFLIISSEIVS